ncbi:hypothetical protein GCM10007981_04640 [Thermocladium modestius]|uniref:Uncharacterized protein n=1 Tax=Thermocladium modestius TaxID=62609 RepID=A0A830GTU3_9CREN|nr:hypothetical protein [Thermocladium modestius]GGP19739.1 hypothetical protein GCM10007981_04640 [Thermocladium modestius]
MAKGTVTREVGGSGANSGGLLSIPLEAIGLGLRVLTLGLLLRSFIN